jgi:ketohexokinase
MYEAAAFLQPKVIDSIGAGDSFNAGFIDARMRNLDMQASLTFACRVAGVKCGQPGFAGLAQRLEAGAGMDITNE